MKKIKKPARRSQVSVSKLLQVLQTNHNADAVRKNFLQHLCRDAGASGAFVVVENKTLAVGRIKPADFNDSVQNVYAKEESVLQDRNVLLLKLRDEAGALGVLGVKNAAVSRSALSAVAALLTFFEREQQLRGLLRLSQNSLRNLAGQSSLISRNNARLFEQLTTNIDRLQSMSKGVIRMQEEERSKISRELHDGIGQALTALKMNLDFVAADLQKQVSTESRQKLEEATKLAEQSLADVRELSRLLRPRMLDDLGLLPTLRWFARTFTNRTGVKVAVETDGRPPKLDAEIETMLFRVTQEALNNIAKHSRSKTAHVRIACLSKAIRLKVEDKGVGFDTAKLNELKADDFGSGLSGIRDRVTLWGGRFVIHSKPGRGTSLSIEVPARYNQSNKARSSRE